MSQKEWTIMIYMAGDNNLAVDMAYAMEQIKEVAGIGADSPNLFVYYDGNSPEIPTLYCDFSDANRPKYVRSFRVPDKLYPVAPKLNENAADKRSVLNFVDWCVNKVEVENGGLGRRAKKYALIFSGHSLGFEDIGLFRDESSGRAMKMSNLTATLHQITRTKEELANAAMDEELTDEEIERATTLLLGQKLNILGFDACVMGMLEVGYQFSNVAKTMIASEGSVPSAGWTYAKILGGLPREVYDNGGSKAVAEHFVRKFIESQDSYTIGGVSVDMTAWDLSRLPDLKAAFNDLSGVLIKCFKDEGSRIYRQMERVILQVHWKCQSYMYDQNVDLGDFCELLDRECGMVADELGGKDTEILQEVHDKCQKVLDELKNTVILSGFSGGAYQYSNGVSVFFPWSRESYDVSRKNYESLLFSNDAGNGQTNWITFLEKYLNEVALRKFEPLTDEAGTGLKYRYNSGIRFDEPPISQAEAAELFVEPDSKLAGERDSKLAGQRDSKLAGQRDSKLAGQRDSKLAGQRDSKLAGQRDSKLAGQKDSKLAGQRDSKMGGGGIGSNQFFDSLRLFKNIESRWDISGFTKKPADKGIGTGK